MRCEEELSRARAVAVSQAFLLGRLDSVRTAWQLAALSYEIDGMEDDPDFLLMTAISSETDHLPLGHARQHWDPVALARKDEELADAAGYWNDQVRVSCERIVERFGPSVLGAS